MAEQVIGSSIRTRFEYRDGKSVLVRQPELFFIDDKALDQAKEQDRVVVDMARDWTGFLPLTSKRTIKRLPAERAGRSTVHRHR